MPTHILETDAYKLSMARSGFPLRRETFYFSFRKGGWNYVPCDLARAVRSRIPDLVAGSLRLDRDVAYSYEHGYEIIDSMVKAMEGQVEIHAVPKGSWVYEREPILTITGPSFLLSWLEPLLLQLHYPIQLATAIKRGLVDSDTVFKATCEEQAEIIQSVFELVGAAEPTIEDAAAEYRKSVQQAAGKLTKIIDPSRIFEVGMRAATCFQEHMSACSALQEVGITRTSNVSAAQRFGMTPVGTMGHEHIQRWGNSLDAFRAMRDMQVNQPSYLLDTYDTISEGLPAAVQVACEVSHDHSVRYDSGDKFAQYLLANGMFSEVGLRPTHILEDSLDPFLVSKFEFLRKEITGVAPEKQLYGFGGFLVSSHWELVNPFTRDLVSAVYKLSQTTGQPRMKFGNARGLGKQSVPGVPVVWRRLRGNGPLGVIGQLGEDIPEDYIELSSPGAGEALRLCNVKCEDPIPYTLSPETDRLVSEARSKLPLSA